MNQYRVIGTRPLRHDGPDKVTGRALYGADIQMGAMLHGRILRSPHAHARIRHIDFRKAQALPGVEGVVTSADLPDPGSTIAELGEGAINLRHLSCNVLAREGALQRPRRRRGRRSQRARGGRGVGPGPCGL